MGQYDVSQICMNGHVMTKNFFSMPEFRQEFCSDCGAKTISTCQACNEHIRGAYVAKGVVGFPDFTSPKFCDKCGEAFPWTNAKREAALEAFFDEVENQKEQEEFERNLNDVIKSTPRTELAASKIKKALTKIPKAAGVFIYNLVVDIASETAAKTLDPSR